MKVWKFESLKILKVWKFEKFENLISLKVWKFESLTSLKVWKFESLKSLKQMNIWHGWTFESLNARHRVVIAKDYAHFAAWYSLHNLILIFCINHTFLPRKWYVFNSSLPCRARTTPSPPPPLDHKLKCTSGCGKAAPLLESADPARAHLNYVWKFGVAPHLVWGLAAWYSLPSLILNICYTPHFPSWETICL